MDPEKLKSWGLVRAAEDPYTFQTWNFKRKIARLEVDPEKVSLHEADARPLDPSTKLLLDSQNAQSWNRRCRQLSNTDGANFVKTGDLSIATTSD